MIENTLRNIDYILMTAGGLVIAAGAAWWIVVRRDPLRGSPMRVNRLGPFGIWLCIAVTLMGWALGGVVAPRLAPPHLSQADLQLWQGIFAANLTAVLNTAACLLVARAAFAGGLRGLGIGRRGLGHDLAVSVAGWLAALCLTGLIVLASQWVLHRFFPQYQPPEHGVFQALRDSDLQSWMRTLAAVGAFTVIPVSEELLFRGIIQTGMQKLVPARPGSLLHRWAAIVMAGSLFGLVHLGTPQFIPALIALGILLGFLYERSGSILAPILVHLMFNGKSLLWDYLSRVYTQSQ